MVDILKREKEFQKLNEELDKKTKSIIEKSSNISQSNIEKSSKNNLKKDEQEERNHLQKNDITKNSFHKANTIPKRFRDSLTNRKAKLFLKPLEVKEKSVQISEDEFENKFEWENYESTNNDIQLSPKNINAIESNNEDDKKNELVKSSSPDQDINRKHTSKASTVPKTLRESLTNRKTKVGKAFISKGNQTKILNDSLNQFIVEDNVITENTTYNLDHVNKSQSNTICDSPSTSSILNSKRLTNSTKSNETIEIDASSIGSSKKSFIAGDSTPQKKKLSSEGLVKYLKSKVSILEVELSNTKSEVLKQTKELEINYETQQKFESQRDQAISKNNALTEQIEKLNEKLNHNEQRKKDRETEYVGCKRELEALKRETKMLKQTIKNLEKRLYRANEEIETSKTNLESVKLSERGCLENARIEKEKIEKQVRELKRQRNEFLNAYKKQLFLIDNLKRQNICMEQCQIIGFGEHQFSKILDLNKE